MREIKFRGVADREGGDGIELVYGSLIVDQNQGCVYKDTHPDRICWKEGTASCNKPIRRDTAMQFTGLKDKNGVEIYEGDIVRSWWHDFKDSEEISTVEWQLDGWVLKYQSNGLSDRLTHTEVPFKEVIGNIYENPELNKGDN